MAIDNVQDQCVTGSPQTAVLSLPFPVVTTSRPGSVPVRCQVAHTRNYAHYTPTPARVIPWRASQNLINKLISGNARAIIRTIVHRYTGMLVTIFYKKKKVFRLKFLELLATRVISMLGVINISPVTPEWPGESVESTPCSNTETWTPTCLLESLSLSGVNSLNRLISTGLLITVCGQLGEEDYTGVSDGQYDQISRNDASYHTLIRHSPTQNIISSHEGRD